MKGKKNGGEPWAKAETSAIGANELAADVPYKVKLYPDAALKMQCEDVEVFDEKLAQFVTNLRETMTVYEGAGLAAPQVGVLKKIAVVEHENTFCVLINPKLIKQEGEQDGDEGCLSFPGIYAPVKRPLRVSISARDTSGAEVVYELEGLLARACLHEMDHLDGRLFIEYLSNLKRSMIRKKMFKRSTERDE